MRRKRIILIVSVSSLLLMATLALIFRDPPPPLNAREAADLIMDEAFYWMSEEKQNAYFQQVRDFIRNASEAELAAIRKQHGENVEGLVLLWDAGQQAQAYAKAPPQNRLQVIDSFIRDYRITPARLAQWDAEIQKELNNQNRIQYSSELQELYSPQQHAMDTLFWSAVAQRVR